ncbi:hypothetical protein N779_12545 [Vibrio coralliilyticus OCN008]|nr:hypothetical protein N779_12545 [Vibrio coralliilyticus OCN008]
MHLLLKGIFAVFSDIAIWVFTIRKKQKLQSITCFQVLQRIL